MRDYVDVKPPKKVQGETIWESIAAGLAAIACIGMIALVALYFSV